MKISNFKLSFVRCKKAADLEFFEDLEKHVSHIFTESHCKRGLISKSLVFAFLLQGAKTENTSVPLKITPDAVSY